MTPSWIGLAVMRPSVTQTLDLISEAEQVGVGIAWSTVGGTNPDALTSFAAAAVRTSRIVLGTSIVPTYPRHPLTLASQALVLAELAPGRLHLGIGPSHRPIIENVFGLPFVSPLAHLREYLTVLRQLLWDGKAEFSGEYFTVKATLPEGRTPPQTPLLISALRENSFRLAGEISDGAISWMCPLTYLVESARPALQAGAEAAGRPVPSLVAHVPVALHGDIEAVRAAARTRLGYYGRLPFYARMFEQAGYPPTSDGVMPAALFDNLVVSGDATTVATQLSRIHAAGMDQILLQQVVVGDEAAERQHLLAALSQVS